MHGKPIAEVFPHLKLEGTLQEYLSPARVEHVAIDRVYGHGGLFKTEGVGQNYLAAAIHAPVTVMETAGEGGAWGIALLADYMVYHRSGESLEDYLQNHVFTGMTQKTVSPDPEACIDDALSALQLQVIPSAVYFVAEGVAHGSFYANQTIVAFACLHVIPE